MPTRLVLPGAPARLAVTRSLVERLTTEQLSAVLTWLHLRSKMGRVPFRDVAASIWLDQLSMHKLNSPEAMIQAVVVAAWSARWPSRADTSIQSAFLPFAGDYGETQHRIQVLKESVFAGIDLTPMEWADVSLLEWTLGTRKHTPTRPRMMARVYSEIASDLDRAGHTDLASTARGEAAEVLDWAQAAEFEPPADR